jgi:A/G-specific adenine glycosylase
VLGAVVAMHRDRVLIARRRSSGLLGGMWEFPSAALESAAEPNGPFNPQFVKELHKIYGLRLRRHRSLITIQHAYSHFRVTVHAYSCKIGSLRPRAGLRWSRLQDLRRYPMGRVDRQIADTLRI